MKRYFSLVNTDDKEAELYIYGDITSYPYDAGDVSSYSIAEELSQTEGKDLTVYINSYGGEVAEGLAIYNALRRHAGRVQTVADGFVCSAAMLPFLAGSERVMSLASLLMIHNVWTFAEGDAGALRKEAQALEEITQATRNAYMEVFTGSEEELTALMDAETWILPEKGMELGFATAIMADKTVSIPSQSGQKAVFRMMREALLHQESPPNSGGNRPIQFLQALANGIIPR